MCQERGGWRSRAIASKFGFHNSPAKGAHKGPPYQLSIFFGRVSNPAGDAGGSLRWLGRFIRQAAGGGVWTASSDLSQGQSGAAQVAPDPRR